MAVLLLSFASGLPYNLTGFTVQAWLASEGLDIRTIGIFTLVSLPYLFKFLWAPFLDRYLPPILGRRRGWILIYQLCLTVAIGVMGFCSPTKELHVLGAVARSGGHPVRLSGHRDRRVSRGCHSRQRAWTRRSGPIFRLPYGRHVGGRGTGLDCRAPGLAPGFPDGGMPHGGDDAWDDLGAGARSTRPAAAHLGRRRVASAARAAQSKRRMGIRRCWCCFTRWAMPLP